MSTENPRCPGCRREFAAFVARRRWVCVYCGIHEPFAAPEPAGREPLPSRAPLGAERDQPFVSWEEQRFTSREVFALLRLKLERDRLLLAVIEDILNSWHASHPVAAAGPAARLAAQVGNMLDFALRVRSMQRLMIEECAASRSAAVRRRVRQINADFVENLASLLRAGGWVQEATDPTYLDVGLETGASFAHELSGGHAAFVYVYEGSVRVGPAEQAATVAAHELAVLGPGARVELRGRGGDSTAQVSRAILVAGRPLREPVARYGPFVMSTRDELMQAFQDLQDGKF